jgi:hypothetical protein
MKMFIAITASILAFSGAALADGEPSQQVAPAANLGPVTHPLPPVDVSCRTGYVAAYDMLKGWVCQLEYNFSEGNGTPGQPANLGQVTHSLPPVNVSCKSGYSAAYDLIMGWVCLPEVTFPVGGN